jgi:hypothetical protein
MERAGLSGASARICPDLVDLPPEFAAIVPRSVGEGPMKIVYLACLLPIAIFSTALTASAQTASPADSEPGLTRVSISRSVSVPLSKTDDRVAKQDEALLSFYKLVGSACAMVRETIADTCEIISINMNLSSNDGSEFNVRIPAAIRVNGQIEMLVRLKTDVGPPTAENSRRRATGGTVY